MNDNGIDIRGKPLSLNISYNNNKKNIVVAEDSDNAYFDTIV